LRAASGGSSRAELFYTQALRLAWQRSNVLGTSTELQGVAMALAGQARPVKALRLDGAAATALRRLGQETWPPFWLALQATYLGRARTALGPGAAEAEWEEGKQMGLERAVVYALDLEAD
jgi:hypothetical protein